jgi:hypothetical protein
MWCTLGILPAGAYVCLFELLFSFLLFLQVFLQPARNMRMAGARCRRRIWRRCRGCRRAGLTFGIDLDPADQVCARFASGSATTAPPELKSQNGVLEVTFKFLTTTDSQGLARYCYVTDTGLEAPTLRVNPATS